MALELVSMSVDVMERMLGEMKAWKLALRWVYL